MASNDLARLVVRLEAQTAQYDATLKRVGRDLKRFRADTGTALTGIQRQFSEFGRNIARSFAIGSVTAALYGLTTSIRQAVATGDELGNFAAKTGLSAKAVSELAYAAKIANVDLGGLETGIKKMQVSVSSLGTETKGPIVEAFAAIGLVFKDLKDLQPDQQLELIADQISKLQDPADRTRAAVALFGKSGADLLPLFEQGAEGIRRLRAETPHIFSEASLKQLSDADDALVRLDTSFKGLSATLATTLAPALSGFADGLSNIINNKDFSFFEKLMLPFSHPEKFLEIAKGSKGGPTNSGPMGRSLPGLTPAGGKPAPGFKPDAGELQRAALDIAAMSAPVAQLTAKYEAQKAKLAELSKQFPSLAASASAALQNITLEYQAALFEAERFDNAVSQNALSSIAPTMDENALALANYFKTINEEGGAATNRFIELRDAIQDTSTDMTVFGEQAARNMQDTFANFLFNPFEDGLKGMLKGFVDVLRRMVAEAAAAQIFKFLGGTEGVGGFFAGLLGGVPGRAIGGPVAAGSAYMVGEQGPEMFVPGVSGNIVPNGGGMVTVKQSNVYHIDSRTDAAAIRQYVDRATAESARQTIDALRDQRSRGRGL